MGLWLNLGELNKTKTIQLIANKMDLTGNYSHVFTNYKKGKIEMESKIILPGDSTQRGYNSLFKSAITSKLINSIPLDDPLILAATSFSMEGVKQVLKDKKLYNRGRQKREVFGNLFSRNNKYAEW